MTGMTRLRRPFSLRVVTWVLHMALPLLGLWMLIAQPQFDVRWEHDDAHFWLVLATAAVSFGLAARISEQARRRGDARLFLVSLAFGCASGFLGLHALATPGVLLDGPSTSFNLSTPFGLLVAGGLALVSSFELEQATAAKVIALHGRLRVLLVVLLVAWAAGSLGGLAVLAGPLPEPTATVATILPAVIGPVLYGIAALALFALYRARPAAILLSVLTAYVLLAESMIAIAIAPNWHASWWEWHLLMLAAFGFVAYSARVQYHREGSRSGLFAGIALEQTVAEIRRDHSTALEALVDGMQTRRPDEWVRVRAGLAERFELTERQLAVLERAAEALAAERDQIRRLAALVAVGERVSVIATEDELVADAANLVRGAFGTDRVRLGVLHGDELVFAGDGCTDPEGALARARSLEHGEPCEDEERLVLPLTVKGRAVGVLEAPRPAGGFAERDRAVLASLASQVSIALENARLYHQLDGLFRSYMSPEVATALLADPQQAALGGAVADVTVLMADLIGFTPYAERTPPEEVVAMLNTYYGAVVPCVLDQGGTVVQFVGDAVMALFGAPVRQPDHAERAVRAGVALQAAAAAVACPGWPQFRVGVNTGPALVGNIGSDAMRNFTAIGDTTNLAARLQAAAPAGGVVVGAATWEGLADGLSAEPLGPLRVKGKSEPVPAFLLIGPAKAG